MITSGGFLFTRENSAIVTSADYTKDIALGGIGLNYVPQCSFEELNKNKVIFIRHGKAGSNLISNPMIDFMFKESYDTQLLEVGWTQCREK